MKKIALIVALDTERDLLLGVLEGMQEEKSDLGKSFYRGRVGHLEVIVVQSGIGKVNAAISASELISRYHPDAVINSGVAGGVGKRLNPLDVVAAQKCAYHDVWCMPPNAYGQVQGCPLYYAANSMLLEQALRLGAVPVTLCTGDIFVEKETVPPILAHFPDCEVVDMESAAIAQVCHIKKVPFLSLRVISDSADSENNLGQYINFWDEAPKATFRVVRGLLAVLE